MSDKPSYPGNTIMVRPNGPLICLSDTRIEIQDSEGKLLQQGQDIALCRCGASKNKPFCDGSHRNIEFQGEQEFSDERTEDIDGLHGELVITVKTNAMLSIKGPVTIFSRSGNSVTTRTKGALCRCGESKKKPFCDASHKQCGFEG